MGTSNDCHVDMLYLVLALTSGLLDMALPSGCLPPAAS